MTIKLFALFLLVTSSLAAPVAQSPTKPFTLSVPHNHKCDLRGQKINAAGGALNLGLKSPSTFCPAPGTVPLSECPAGKETVFAGLLSMDVKVPGGQLAYVGPNGALGYTAPHSAFIPPGSFTSGFTWTALHGNSNTERGELDFKAAGENKSGFLACHDGLTLVPGATYQIFAYVPGFNQKNCIELGRLRTTQFKTEEFGAWEYT